MQKPKFILINGFAGSGKTTMAARYIKDHPLALMIEGDELIVRLGQWTVYELKARELVRAMTKQLASTHLKLGYDVVVSCLMTDATHVNEYEEIAAKYKAEFYEIYLKDTDKQTSIKRLLERGTWGEVGLDPLSERDLPEIEEQYEAMIAQLPHRPGAKAITIKKNDIEHTYRQLLASISEQQKSY